MTALPTQADKGKREQIHGTGVDEKKKTILIYSPDLNFCFSLSMLFQDRYTVVTTTNPGMLEAFVGNYSADLVIVDAVPTERMIERLNSLKGLNRNLPIIMLYVYNSRDVGLDKIAREQVDSVFYKPFEVGVVSKRIEELLTD